MKNRLENGTIRIFLEGRIDGGNAGEFEREMFAALDAAPDAAPVLDAENLIYISSAGLRALMKLRKRVNRPVPIHNVSPDVYDILQVTGFSELLEVHKKLREISVDGCPLLGEGANGKVYRLTEDEMIKVFRPGITLDGIEMEREASRKAFLLGVPCAIPFDTVRCGESYGTVYELLKAATLVERIRENPDTLSHYAEASAQLLRQLHDIELPEGQMSPASQVFHRAIDAVTKNFTPEETALLHQVYDAVPPGNRFIHNDFHAKNIMEANGELILIDLGDAGYGNPLIDLIHCKLVYNFMGTGTQHAPDDMTFIGLTYAETERFWNIFLRSYCGDAGEAERLNRIMTPFAMMMYFVTAMGHSMLPDQYRSVYANKVRELVFPHKDEMLSAFRE